MIPHRRHPRGAATEAPDSTGQGQRARSPPPTTGGWRDGAVSLAALRNERGGPARCTSQHLAEFREKHRRRRRPRATPRRLGPGTTRSRAADRAGRLARQQNFYKVPYCCLPARRRPRAVQIQARSPTGSTFGLVRRCSLTGLPAAKSSRWLLKVRQRLVCRSAEGRLRRGQRSGLPGATPRHGADD